jgi:hypothetical protein
MNRKTKLWWTQVGFAFMAGIIAIGGSAAAASERSVWLGPSGGGGWNSFMQVIMQKDYRLQMSNGNPYWNTLMVPVAETSISSGMSSYMGLPSFGFCPVPGQCYMVLVQRPLPYSSMTCPPVPPAMPGQAIPNQPGKPTSLW